MPTKINLALPLLLASHLAEEVAELKNLLAEMPDDSPSDLVRSILTALAHKAQSLKNALNTIAYTL